MNLVFDGINLITDSIPVSGNYLWENQVNKKVYVGASSKMSDRLNHEIQNFSRHKSAGLTKLYRSVNKYGLQNFRIYSLNSLSFEEALIEEGRLIVEYDSKKNGLNCTDGGEGVINLDPSIQKATIEKIKNFWTVKQKTIHSGKMKTWFESKDDDEQQRLIQCGKSWVNNPECVARHLKNTRAAKTPDRIRKQSDSLKKHYENNKHHRAMSGEIISPDGKIIKFESVNKLILKYKLGETSIRKVLSGQKDEYKGWKQIKL